MLLDRRAVIAGLTAASLPLSPATAADGGDLQRVERWLTALHPGLYRYQTPRAFHQRLRGLERDWAVRSDLASRFLALSRFTAAIRCGHSYCNPNNQSDAVVEQLFANRRALPLHFRWLGEAMVVTSDPLQSGIAPGTEILSIDGVPARRILAALLPYTRADGHNRAKQLSLLSVEGRDRFETFDLFHPLLFPAEGAFDLVLRDPAGRRSRRALAPISRAERASKQPPSLDKGGDKPWWTFERRGAVALMTMPNWAVYQTKWQWQPWLQARFEDMARTETRALIIDLRGNEGGIDIGDHIVRHLIDEPLPPFRYRRLARFRTVPEALRPGLQTWDKSFFTLGETARAFDETYVELVDADEGPSAVLQPQAPRFAGKVILLIDSANSSATHQFAARVQEKRLATLVGTETGGNQRGINGGAFFFATLPDSGLEFDLPLIATFPPAMRPDRGIVPDVQVALTARSIAQARDVVLERAVQLAAQA